MEHTPLLMNKTKRSFCGYEIIDMSEPVIITGTLCSLVGFGYSMVSGDNVLSALTGIMSITGAVSEWRVRALGIAKKLMDSVRTLQYENEKLHQDVNRLQDELDNFTEIVGILGDNVGDIQTVKDQLLQLYKQYKIENNKYISNNLLTLFGLIDKNQDSKLDSQEMKRMKEYIKIVYKEDFNFDILDKDGDGCVSLSEFFQKFRKKYNSSPNDSIV